MKTNLAAFLLPLVLAFAASFALDESTTEPLDGQVLVYVGDPAKSLAGTSDCAPCNRLCRDLRKHYKTDRGRYIIGTESRAFFRLVKAPKGMATPSFRYPGRRNTSKGYNGNHLRLVSSHPLRDRIESRK